jgi:hypothetical protein
MPWFILLRFILQTMFFKKNDRGNTENPNLNSPLTQIEKPKKTSYAPNPEFYIPVLNKLS